MKKSILFALLVIISKASLAQFTVTGEVKPRFEYRNGFKTLRPESNFTPVSFVEQRTRLYFNYEKDKLRLHISLQDIRMWGNHDQIYKTDPSLTNVYEGYAKYQATENWAFKIGRQMLSYDTQRFMGGLDWAMQARSHDAVLVRYENKKGYEADVAFALNNSGVEPSFINTYTMPYGMNSYKNMQMVHLSKKWKKAYVSLLFQNDGRQLSTDTVGQNIQYRQTYGLVANGNVAKNVKLEGEFYYQGGTNSIGQTVNAFFASARATLTTKLTPITLGGDYASGTKLEDAGKDNAWNPLYGTNHKWYGYMDYFYVGNGHGQGGRTTGLIDLYFHTNFKLAKKHSLALHGHYFMSPVTLYSTKPGDTPNTIELSSGLATEFDLVYKFVITKEIYLQVGYSHMLPEESMEAIKNGSLMDGRASSETNNWAFVMIRVKPELFSSKKKKTNKS